MWFALQLCGPLCRTRVRCRASFSDLDSAKDLNKDTTKILAEINR